MELVKPDISFANYDADSLHAEVMSAIESALNRSIQTADPVNLLARSLELIILQQRVIIDEAAKMNLLAFAKGDYLDAIGQLYGVERLKDNAATTTFELKLSTARNTTTIIDQGVRVTAGDEVYFATDEAAIFAAGTTTATIGATCTENGVIGNGYQIGELNQIVDPRPFWQSVKNLTVTETGADTEDDERYRARLHESLERFSVAGPVGAYEFWAKTASKAISDVAVWSPEPGKVNIVPLLNGGVVPGQELLDAVDEVCNDRSIRPLTDQVTVAAPRIVNFDIDVDFWINRSDQARAARISAAVSVAIDEYITWQRSKLGLDINPTELIYKIRAAGAKRCVVRAPSFVATDADQVAIVDAISVNYRGLETD